MIGYNKKFVYKKTLRTAAEICGLEKFFWNKNVHDFYKEMLL